MVSGKTPPISTVAGSGPSGFAGGFSGDNGPATVAQLNAPKAVAVGPDGTIYVGSDDKVLYALDGATGREKWEFLTEAEIDSSPAIAADGTVFISDRNNGAIRVVTGRRLGPSFIPMTQFGPNFAADPAGIIVL
jgi:outer membrane protein assembly factor BamB